MSRERLPDIVVTWREDERATVWFAVAPGNGPWDELGMWIVDTLHGRPEIAETDQSRQATAT